MPGRRSTARLPHQPFPKLFQDLAGLASPQGVWATLLRTAKPGCRREVSLIISFFSLNLLTRFIHSLSAKLCTVLGNRKHRLCVIAGKRAGLGFRLVRVNLTFLTLMCGLKHRYL